MKKRKSVYSKRIRKLAKATIALVLCLIMLAIIVSLTGCTPSFTKTWNTYWHDVQKADDETNYKTKKKVEDTCRAMISSYESDKLKWQQYKDSDNEEKQSWAEQAKMRANKTASTYNNYILENSYIWSGNVPADIATELEYIE